MMKKNISALLGVLGAYLVCVGEANRWDILAVEPKECVHVIATLVWLSFIFGPMIWFIICMFGEDN